MIDKNIPSSGTSFFHRENTGLGSPTVFSPGTLKVWNGIPDARRFAENHPLPVNVDSPHGSPAYMIYPIDFNGALEVAGQVITGRYNFVDLPYATNTNGLTPILFIRIGSESSPEIPLIAGKSYSGLSGDKLFIRANNVDETGYLMLAYDPSIDELLTNG